jgi:hypothetical protein
VVDLRGLPGDWAHEPLGNSVSTTVFDRISLVNSFAELGRFTRAAEHVAEMIRLAEPTQQASSLSMAYFAAGVLLLSQGYWAKARILLEQSIATALTGNVKLMRAICSDAEPRWP